MGPGSWPVLYDRAAAHLQDVGYAQASLWVLERNTHARCWYERLGWSCTGERKPVYEPAGIDGRSLHPTDAPPRVGHSSRLIGSNLKTTTVLCP